MIKTKLTELIGNTPIIKYEGVYIKLEGFNLGGSIKDRIALNMINTYEENGDIKPGDTLIIPTSGNTGIGFCLVGVIKGYKIIIVMPENMSVERINMMRAYGAQVILTKASGGMSEAVSHALSISKDKNYFYVNQFDDINNPLSYKGCAQEIIHEFTKIDYLVMGIGTGGSISGLAQELKKVYPCLKVIGVEPQESAIITTGKKGPHGIQGIGAGFIPKNLNMNVIDRVVTVSTEDSINEFNKLRKKGFFVGISTGCNIVASNRIFSQDKSKIVLTVSPDFGAKYLSMIKE
ncbi:MAG: cysteine synthase family protein [Bacilli bacterium]